MNRRVGYNPVISIGKKKKSASGIIVLLKTPTKCQEFLPDFICKNIRFSACFQFFQQTRTVTIFRENGTMAHILMAKPIRGSIWARGKHEERARMEEGNAPLLPLSTVSRLNSFPSPFRTLARRQEIIKLF